ncbi:MAG: hypothetical protein AAGA60_30970 [Cyanobacteria bacterium P01_E01_bin.42]
MFDSDPPSALPGYQVLPAGTAFTPSEPTIAIPLSTFPQLTESEATNDIRQFIAAFAEVLFLWFTSLSTEDRPSQLEITGTPPQPIINSTQNYRKSVTISPIFEHSIHANVAPES